MKVWQLGDGTTRFCVAAPTIKRALELLEEANRPHSYYLFKKYAAETGNEVQLRLALEGEGVWAETERHSQEWRQVV